MTDTALKVRGNGSGRWFVVGRGGAWRCPLCQRTVRNRVRHLVVIHGYVLPGTWTKPKEHGAASKTSA